MDSSSRYVWNASHILLRDYLSKDSTSFFFVLRYSPRIHQGFDAIFFSMIAFRTIRDFSE